MSPASVPRRPRAAPGNAVAASRPAPRCGRRLRAAWSKNFVQRPRWPLASLRSKPGLSAAHAPPAPRRANSWLLFSRVVNADTGRGARHRCRLSRLKRPRRCVCRLSCLRARRAHTLSSVSVPQEVCSMRLLIAMMKHETNTFSPVPTPLTRFGNGPGPLYGEAAVQAYRGTGTGLGAYLDLAEGEGAEIVLPVAASAPPSGPVEDAAYAAITEPILAEAAKGGFDGILLDLHGAMVTESLEDG